MPGFQTKKNFLIALSELDKESATRFAIRVLCKGVSRSLLFVTSRLSALRIDYRGGGSSKCRRTQSKIASSRPISTLLQHSHKPRRSPSIHDDEAELPGTSQDKSTQRSHCKSTGKRNPSPPGWAAETVAMDVRELKRLRLTWPRHVLTLAERDLSGLGGYTGRLCSLGFFCILMLGRNST